MTRPMPGRAAFDGGKGFGQVVGIAMAEEAIRLARGNGVAFVNGRHMGHTGRIGAYPEAIARQGCLGIAIWGAAKQRIGVGLRVVQHADALAPQVTRPGREW